MGSNCDERLGGDSPGSWLTPIVEEAVGEPVVVVNVEHLSGGSSRDTWSFDARGKDGRVQPLIFQQDRAVASGAFGIGLVTEADVLRAAAAAKVPVPRVLASSAEATGRDRAYLLVERVPGETIPQRILRDERFAAARSRLAAQYGDALGRIQQVPLADVAMLPAEDALDRWQQVLRDSGHPHPVFEVAFRWLEAHQPPPSDPVLVHGDYRNGNGIVRPDGLRAVIDWELAHLGDPMEDLGWLCLRAWRFGFAKPVGGFGEYRDLLDAYTAATGRVVDAATLRWWMVVGTVRWGAVCVLRAMWHLSGTVRSLEFAAIGRRVCEAEYDLLLLLP